MTAFYHCPNVRNPRYRCLPPQAVRRTISDMKILQEFKEFAIKGNALDLAVGVIIGAAFNTIVQSLVDDLLMPPLSLLVGDIDFSDKMIVLQDGATEAQTVAITYGVFVNALVEFLIIAFAIFLVVRWINRLRKSREASNNTPESTTQKCPHCRTEISAGATRCPNCTSDLTEPAPQTA